MSDSHQVSGIDQAALLAALLAAAWQVTSDPGAWGPINTPLGLMLLLIITAYTQPTLTRRYKGIYLQVAAVAVCASVALGLALAWPVQFLIIAPATPKVGDSLGELTTNTLFPVVLMVGVPLIYSRIARRLIPPQAKPSNDRLRAPEPSA